MKIAAVVLAAGAGTRLGGIAKALLPRGDRSFLQCILETAHANDAIVVVGPPFGEAVAAHARGLGARVVVNPEPSRGMATSINAGFAAVGDADAAWLWPVDHPDVRVSTLAALRTALGTCAVARPVYGGRGGHPPLVARVLFPALATCTNAREVIAAADRVDVEVDDLGTIADVDDRADLASGSVR